VNEFRRLAARIDQHMQQLGAQGVNDPQAIVHRMMGYTPDLHKIWVGASDQQLMALSREFPGFYRYGRIMEEASQAERNKASRPPMTVWQSSPMRTSDKQLSCWPRPRPWSAATRRFVPAAACTSSSHKSTSWAGCTGNGWPIWPVSRLLYGTRSPRHCRT